MPETVSISVQRLFIFTIILKIALSLAGWYVGTTLALWTLGFALPLLVMSAYILIGLYRRDPDEVSDEKFADSCYYLGFIFTISSIIVALLDIDKLGENGRLAEIAVRFSAAMVSTVFGLVVRVYLVNFRKDLSDITKAMEDDLLEAERNFRTHLNLATDNLKALNNKVNEASKDVVARLEVAIVETAEANTREFERLFQDVGQKINTTAELSTTSITASSGELKKSLQQYMTSLVASAKHHEIKLNDFSERLGQQLDKFSTTFSGALADLNTRLENFTQKLDGRLNDVTFPADLFKEQLSKPIDGLKSSLSSVANDLTQFATDITTGSHSLNESLLAVPASVKETTEQIRKSVEDQRKTIEKTNAQEEALLKLARNVKHFETALTKSAEGLNQHAEATNNLRAAVITIVEDHAALRDFASQQSNAINSMTSQIHRLCETMDVITTRISTLPDTNSEVISAINTSSVGLVGAISAGFSDLSREFDRSIAALAQDLLTSQSRLEVLLTSINSIPTREQKVEWNSSSIPQQAQGL